MEIRKSIAAIFFTCLVASAAAGGEPPLRLPATDDHGKRVGDYVEADPVPAYRHAPEAAREAFRDIKYGVRIHWGLYSAYGEPGESWPFLKAPAEKKQAWLDLYNTWNPEGFDAEEWMSLFAGCGLKMFAFTAKHHEGFSLFDTKTRVKQRVNWAAPGGPRAEPCDLAFSVMETPFKRDIVRELCDAARKHGIKIDLYFSNTDWYDADFRPYGWSPVTTPGASERPELYGRAPVSERKGMVSLVMPDPSPQEEARMMARHRAQLTELLTNYGRIDMVCLDMWLGKKVWPQFRETMLELRKIQPDVMFRARGIGNYGDFYTPEGFTPGDKENTAMPWFEITPLGRSFSYETDAAKHKGGAWIVRKLVDVVAKGGNFMVGIGPDRNGRFHPQAVENLREAGAWLATNGEGIYATRPRDGGLWKEGDNLRFTRSKDGKVLYAFPLDRPVGTLRLATVRPRPGSEVLRLGDDRPLTWQYSAAEGMTLDLPARRADGLVPVECYRIEVDVIPE